MILYRPGVWFPRFHRAVEALPLSSPIAAGLSFGLALGMILDRADRLSETSKGPARGEPLPFRHTCGRGFLLA